MSVPLLTFSAPAVRGAEPPSSPFRFAVVDDRSLGLWESDKAVLVYNHGAITKKGLPGARAHSSYIHPLYGLDGEVLTDDFPADHLHHRGLFWAWPHVTVDGRHHDQWMLDGSEPRFIRWGVRETQPEEAQLGVENGWFVGPRQVMREQVMLRVHKATHEGRAIDLDLTWTPLGQSITLGGAEGKSYGGLTLRFAPGRDTVITVPSGPSKDDLYMKPLPWADLTRLWAGRQTPSGAAIFVHPRHPDYPPTWLTRHYGVLCLGWPGVQPRTLAPGEPVRCRYQIWIHRGQLAPERLSKLQANYAAEVEQPAR